MPTRKASDADGALITTIVSGASVCVPCIAKRVDLKPAHVDSALLVLGKSLKITARMGRCDACLKQTVVHHLG